jgi:hypothetical protein
MTAVLEQLAVSCSSDSQARTDHTHNLGDPAAASTVLARGGVNAKSSPIPLDMRGQASLGWQGSCATLHRWAWLQLRPSSGTRKAAMAESHL